MQNEAVSDDFKNKAIALAEAFKMQADDIADAYRGKPDSLTAHFNSVNKSLEKRDWYLGWTIGCVAVGAVTTGILVPLAFYPGYKLYEKHRDANQVEKAVRSEVEAFKNNGSAVKAPELGV